MPNVCLEVSLLNLLDMKRQKRVLSRLMIKYGVIAKPLYNLTCLKMIFCWTNECKNAFNKLKEAMSQAPILNLPDFKKHFYLATDACGTGIGCLLSQNETDGGLRPIAYAGRAFSKAEQHCNTTEQELLSVI